MVVKRPDFDLVSLFVRQKWMSLDAGITWLGLPLFDIPTVGVYEKEAAKFNGRIDAAFAAYYFRELKEGKNVEWVRSMVEGEFYFHDFIVKVGTYMTRVKLNQETKKIQFFFLSLDGKTIPSNARSQATLTVSFIETETVCELALEPETKWLQDWVNANEGNGSLLFNDVLIVLLSAALFRDFNNRHDHYLVKVTQEKKEPKPLPKAPINEHLRAAQGPRIIYLSRLPDQPGDTEEKILKEQREPQCPHAVRGHWKTLRHERYRFHPKYRVENGIYVKPYWVGPKTATAHGNIYTILE